MCKQHRLGPSGRCYWLPLLAGRARFGQSVLGAPRVPTPRCAIDGTHIRVLRELPPDLAQYRLGVEDHEPLFDLVGGDPGKPRRTLGLKTAEETATDWEQTGSNAQAGRTIRLGP